MCFFGPWNAPSMRSCRSRWHSLRPSIMSSAASNEPKLLPRTSKYSSFGISMWSRRPSRPWKLLPDKSSWRTKRKPGADAGMASYTCANSERLQLGMDSSLLSMPCSRPSACSCSVVRRCSSAIGVKSFDLPNAAMRSPMPTGTPFSTLSRKSTSAASGMRPSSFWRYCPDSLVTCHDGCLSAGRPGGTSSASEPPTVLPRRLPGASAAASSEPLWYCVDGKHGLSSTHSSSNVALSFCSSTPSFAICLIWLLRMSSTFSGKSPTPAFVSTAALSWLWPSSSACRFWNFGSRRSMPAGIALRPCDARSSLSAASGSPCSRSASPTAMASACARSTLTFFLAFG
mmetsp:Transcript_10105/g.35394  ORF Transcript_10105/g.35394 Transcript_10105/m.35394 type:complete len:343 (+) Transcript_10105:2470-3498(+)